MNLKFKEKQLDFLTFQRNTLLAFSMILGLSLLLSLTALFWKDEKVIILPPTVEKEFWVDGKSVSPSYLEQFGYFLGQLFLTKSAQTADSQRAILLKYTDPSLAPFLNQRLKSEEEDLKKQGASYVFFPKAVHVDAQKKQVTISGDRTLYVSKKEFSTESENYLFGFTYRGGRLLLSEVKSLEGQK